MKNPSRRALADGVLFPAGGATAAAQRICAAAIETLDPEAALRIRSEGHWPLRYSEHLARVRELAGFSPGNGLHVAQHALAAAQDVFRFARDGLDQPLTAALNGSSHTPLHTGIAGASGLRAPAGPLGMRVSDESVLRGLDGRMFVLLGVFAQVELANQLLGQGAVVLAVDGADSANWARLLKTAGQSPGRLVFPSRLAPAPGATLRQQATAAGADLSRYAPELCAWLAQQLRTQHAPVVFGWAAPTATTRSAAGAGIAVDAIAAALLHQRSGAAQDCVLPVTEPGFSNPHQALAGQLLAWRREWALTSGLRAATIEKITLSRKFPYSLRAPALTVHQQIGSQNRLLTEGIS